MKLEKLWTFKEITLMVTYILLIRRINCILLISSCPINSAKFGKLPIIASYTCKFISKLLKVAKVWWFFPLLYKDLHYFF